MAFRTTLAAVALIACTAAAQTVAPPRPPYEGQVTTRDVYVRSSPGGYECIKLHAPAKVQVIARAYDWLKIAPPARCYSLLAKQYVTVSADGKSGTVTGDSVRVRAGSELKPTRAGVIQTHLNIGDKVVILGEQKARIGGKETDFYRITPPAGVVLWISAKYVRPAGAVPTPPVHVATTRRASTQPTTGPVVGNGGAPIVTTIQPVRQVSREVASLNAAEGALVAENAKPREERNLASVLAMYRAIPLTPGSPLEPMVKAQIKSLEMQQALDADMREMIELLAEVADRQEALKLAARDTDIKLAITRAVRASAEGVLDRSNLFQGGPMGKRYVLRRATGAPRITYVQCTTGLVDFDKHLGATIRVMGVSWFDLKLPAHVIEVEEMSVVTPAPPSAKPVTTRPAVTVRQPDKPAAPKPTPKDRPEPKAKPQDAPKPKDQARAADKPASRPASGLPVVETVTTPETGVDAKDYE